MLDLKKTVENDAAEIRMEGRLDTTTAPQLEAAIQEIQPSVTRLVLDLSELEYISSAGLRVLLSAQKASMGKGELILRNVNQAVMEVFDVTGFSEILTIE